MRGGKRVNSGRKKKIDANKKIQVGIKLQEWIVEWMSYRNESRAVIIEKALIETYKLNLNEGNKMYYAESYGQNVAEDIYGGGMVMVEANSQPYCDLHRFVTKKERDSFVINGIDCIAISSVDAREKHKDQFSYWNK